MMTLFDDEQILKAYIKDVKENTAKETEERTAREIEKRTAKETAERLIKKGKMSLDEIADCVPALSLDELKEIQAKVMQFM